MKSLIITTLIICICIFSLLAQKEYKNCTYTKFKNGKISTATCWDDNKYFGISTAYNMLGEKIGEWRIGRMAQIASVNFTFHANGGVHKAEYGSHPDAGIQWYRSTTTFNEKGEKVDFWEQSHDDGPSKFIPEHLKFEYEQPIVKPKQAEVIKCAIIYTSELWIDNRTNQNIKVNWQSKSGEPKKGVITIAKGKKAKITNWIMAEKYEEPLPFYDLKITNASGKKINAQLNNSPYINDGKLKENKKIFVYELETP